MARRELTLYCYVEGDLIVNQQPERQRRTRNRRPWPYLIDADGNLLKCPRCGKRHDGLPWRKFRRPVVHPYEGHPIYSVWSVCPATLEPVLATSDMVATRLECLEGGRVRRVTNDVARLPGPGRGGRC